MFYLLHGDDEFSSREHLKQLRQQGNFEYNQDTYYGAEVDVKTVIMTSTTMPFLTEQRLVVVQGLPKRKRGESGEGEAAAPAATEATASKGKKGRKGKGGAITRADFEKALAELGTTLPETTVLILLVDETLTSSNALLKAAEKHGKVILSTLPKGDALEKWITQRAKRVNVKIAPDAVTLLANFTGNNLRQLANELDKLSTYVGSGATITIEDVRKLSAQVQEARIFDLTDALAQRNRQQALNILHDLLADGQYHGTLIGLITDQVRLLMLVKEMAQKGLRSAQIAASLGRPPFVIDKTLRQVKNFNTRALEDTYRRLLATDAALKRSRLTPEMALDLLVLQFGT